MTALVLQKSISQESLNGSTGLTMAGVGTLEEQDWDWPSANTSLKPMGSSFKQEAHPALALLLALP